MSINNEQILELVRKNGAFKFDDIVGGICRNTEFHFTESELFTFAKELMQIQRKWKPIESLKQGEAVLLYADSWIDEDFNPEGVREGFRTESDNGPIISAWWNDNQDCYETDTNSAATHWMQRPEAILKGGE